MSPESRKKWGLLAVAIVLLVIGGAALLGGNHVTSSLAVVLSAAFSMRAVRVGRSPSEPRAKGAPGRPGWRHWLGAAGLVVVAVMSFGLLLMYKGRGVWPVYLFAGLGIVSGTYLATLFAMQMRWWFGQ